jgi:phosphonate degradation associated HDIG domain protein
MSNEHETLTSELRQMFAERGNSNYGKEAVTQLEHALQAAMFAEREDAPPSLIVAALLHDIGHLLHDLPEDAPSQGVDDRHEARAAQWLADRFDPAVVAPVALHVAAKRYLCTADPEYFGKLSAPSRQSLELQGGPMTADAAREFESHRFYREAVRLRRWDEAAKVVGLATPSLDHFLGYLPQL